MNYDVEEKRAFANHHRTKALMLAGVSGTLDFYDRALNDALDEIERLQGLLADRTVAAGKHLNLMGDSGK